MASFGFNNLDDDEETWLTPDLGARTVGTQSKPVDLKEWFNHIPTNSDRARASTLSRKLQKYAQKRANRERRDRGVRGSSSLDAVAEVSVERSVSPCYKATLSANSSASNTSTPGLNHSSGTSSSPPELFPLPSFSSPQSPLMSQSSIQNYTSPLVAKSSFSKSASFDSFEADEAAFGITSFSDSPVASSTPQANQMEYRQVSFDDEPPIQESDEDEMDEFYDASNDFPEEVLDRISMTSSCHADLFGNGSRSSSRASQDVQQEVEDGISVVRNGSMSQSLMKVDEEPPNLGKLRISNKNTPTSTPASRNARSSSVSPQSAALRPATTAQTAKLVSQGITTTPLSARDINTTTLRRSREGSRDIHTSPRDIHITSKANPTGILRTPQAHGRPATAITTPSPNINNITNIRANGRQESLSVQQQQQGMNISPAISNGLPSNVIRVGLVNINDYVDGGVVRSGASPAQQSFTGVGVQKSPAQNSGRISLAHSDLNPDLKTMQDLAKQQEDALREAVMQQQQLERKHSWHSDQAKQSSTHSSAASLASSKSADISTLHKTNSKIPGPSRLPRRTGIPTPGSKVPAPSIRGHPTIPQPGVSLPLDDCF